MSNHTFLTKEQYFGDEKLDIFEKRGTKAAITDFAIALNGFVSTVNHVDSDNSLKGRTGYFWTKSDDGNHDACAVTENGDLKTNMSIIRRNGGARPALSFSSIDTISTNEVRGKFEEDKDGVKFVYDGYYPQTAPETDIQDELDRLSGCAEWIRNNRIPEVCTVFHSYDLSENTIKYEKIDGYRHNGKIYVAMNQQQTAQLSNGKKYFRGQLVWFEVEPIKRLISEQGKVTVTEKIIFAGIPFNHTHDYKTENFEKTPIYRFTNEIWAKDVERLKSIVKGIERSSELRKSRLKKLNPDKTKKENRTKMTDTELILDWIESGESVLILGPSGIGKTDRFREWNKEGKIDLIELKLTNGMFPEKVVGSTNFQTGQEIPPTYAKNIIIEAATEKEKEAVKENIENIYEVADRVYESSTKDDKKIVILLDELLNVKPQVQSLVYTLVLNRFIESGKGIKLPENVVIAATGNQKKYSITANDLAEPLEKRFDHILDMKPKVGEWITEYAIPHKIHPAVIGYMLLKYNNTRKSEDISDIGYFYEEPEVGEKKLDANGCKGRTNDPRGWTSISNTLYNFERNLRQGKYKGKDVEDIIQSTIESKLRMEWASDFFDFYNLPTLTPEEVVKGMKEGYTRKRAARRYK